MIPCIARGNENTEYSFIYPQKGHHFFFFPELEDGISASKFRNNRINWRIIGKVSN